MQLTDLHLSRLFPAFWVEEVVRRTNELDADLIVMTGDLIDGDLQRRQEDVRPMAGCAHATRCMPRRAIMNISSLTTNG